MRVAIKVLKDLKESNKREIYILEILKGLPNIINFLGVLKDEDSTQSGLALVTEYIEMNGSKF